MENWQENAWKVWRAEMLAPHSVPMQKALEALAPEQQDLWLWRFKSPVAWGAMTMAEWIKPEGASWHLVPDLHWDMAETPHGVLIAYPDALGRDPLAMAAMGLLWAGAHPGRLAHVISRLGPGALWAASDGGLTGPWPRGLWLQAQGMMGEDGVLKFLEAHRAGWDLDEPLMWGAMPLYAPYLEQLMAGVVPHDAGGVSPQDVPAVLAALHFVPPDIRAGASVLTLKAVDGWLMTKTWRRAGHPLEGLEGGALHW